MANLTPIALADLGAGLDASLTASGVDGKHVGMSPQLLVADCVVTTASADLRLHRYNEALGKWIPSAVAAATYAVGVHELRFVTAEISGRYALVKVGGSGTVEYVFRTGRA